MIKSKFGKNKEIYDELIEKINYAKDNGMDYLSYANLFMKSEPYCNYKEVIDEIREELGKYEYR